MIKKLNKQTNNGLYVVMFHPQTLKKRVYYSQNREDIILESFFVGEKTGFYVDVGANHPTLHSVTKLFSEKGWTGINIEPIKSHFNLLEKDRPKDININIGISDKNETLEFTEVIDGDGLSTFSTEMQQDYKSSEQKIFNKTKSYNIDLRGLTSIL